MTDEQADAPLFQMTPTADAYMQLATQITEALDRLSHLEASQPATSEDVDPGEVTEDDLDALHERINRHRAEIEQIKRVINQIISFLGSNGIPKTQPADSMDTVQPQTRNLIQ